MKLPLNSSSLDRGLCQVNMGSYFKRHHIKNTAWNRSKFGTKLVVDDKFNLKAAVEEIRFWERSKKSWQSYSYIWARYNAGGKPGSVSKLYAEDIALRIKVINELIGKQLRELYK